MSAPLRSLLLKTALILGCVLPTGAHSAIDERLAAWWSQWHDPVLSELIQSAQAHSAGVAQAALRIEQARAAAVAAGAAIQPSVNLSGGAQRGTVLLGTRVLTASQTSLTLPASWELDLFGRVAQTREAARARLEAEQAQAAAVRVALAAETASVYLQLRFCEAQLALAQGEARSRQASAAALEQAVAAGLSAPVQAALARSVRADAQQRVLAQATECQAFVQALGVLSATDTASLSARLAPLAGRLPQPERLAVQAVPAALLTQRPDVAAAEIAVAAASAELGAARADRYPRLSLNGSIGPLLLAAGGVSSTVLTWSIGPALSLPVLDGGRRAANESVAQVAYDTAVVRYRETARRAAQEVEEALLRLRMAAEREPDVAAGGRAQREIRQATAARRAAGLASALELEEAERGLLAADTSQLALHRDRLAAAVQLYRALGGGWSSADPAAAAPARKE
jgi:NodT family efflux transporter outer membrane factor (OMF) lipoprotein